MQDVGVLASSHQVHGLDFPDVPFKGFLYLFQASPLILGILYLLMKDTWRVMREVPPIAHIVS